jgi:hypothetical protein
VDCNFLYADRDLDGHLSLSEWTQLFKLMSEVHCSASQFPSQHVFDFATLWADCQLIQTLERA